MEDLDALLADLEVSLPLSHLNIVPSHSSVSRSKADCLSQDTVQPLVSARRYVSSSPGSLDAYTNSVLMSLRITSISVPHLNCNGLPLGDNLMPSIPKSSLASLSINLSELDSLLSELDEVQLSAESFNSAPDYDMVGDEENNNGIGRLDAVEKSHDMSATRSSAMASKASQELDELMGSFSDMSIMRQHSLNSISNHQHSMHSPEMPASVLTSTTQGIVRQAIDVDTRQPCADLNSLLIALDHNLAKQGVVVEPKGCCAACSKAIVGQVLTAVGKVWHPEHFTCVHCGDSLADQNYFERNLQPYCERDYHQLFSPKCVFCSGPILDKCVTVKDRMWHPEHFRCADCQRQLVNQDDFHEINDLIYCEDDYVKKFVAKCSGCYKPIFDSQTSALGRQWHPYCFACPDCRKPFGSSRYFEGADGRPYCEEHIKVKDRAPQCATCNGPVLGRSVTALGRRYHPEHFTCAFCQRALTRGAFKELDNRAYCLGCFDRLCGR